MTGNSLHYAIYVLIFHPSIAMKTSNLSGGTEEYGIMVDKVLEKYPTTKAIACGFSMGGNIITKYVGEKDHQTKFIAVISCCQGYDAEA